MSHKIAKERDNSLRRSGQEGGLSPKNPRFFSISIAFAATHGFFVAHCQVSCSPKDERLTYNLTGIFQTFFSVDPRGRGGNFCAIFRRCWRIFFQQLRPKKSLLALLDLACSLIYFSTVCFLTIYEYTTRILTPLASLSDLRIQQRLN